MLSIRPAAAEDAPLLRTMISELSDFERELDLVSITEAERLRDGFGADAKFRALIAEWRGQPAGYACFFPFYSTWQGRQLLGLVCAATIQRQRDWTSVAGLRSEHRHG
jgi:hypothetical protein